MELTELEAALKLIEQGDIYLGTLRTEDPFYPGLEDDFLARLVRDSIERMEQNE